MARASVRLEGRGVPGLAGGAVFLGIGCFFFGVFGFTSTGRSFAAARGAAVAGVALARTAVAGDVGWDGGHGDPNWSQQGAEGDERVRVEEVGPGRR